MHTPITAFYAGLLAFMYVYLSALVINGRRSKRISLGDNNDKQMGRLIRAHGNFIEYVPLILILMLIAELNQMHQVWIHLTGSLLLLGRVLHAVGLTRKTSLSWHRVAGMVLTLCALLQMAALNLVTFYFLPA